MLKDLVCKIVHSRGHPTDDSIVPVELWSRVGLSLGLYPLQPLRGQDKLGMPLLLKFFPCINQTTIAEVTKQGYRNCGIFNMFMLFILMN